MFRGSKLFKILFNSLHNSTSRFSSNNSTPVDKFGRKHDYLRVSLTERCNLRCLYCMPEEGIRLAPADNYLNLNETKRLLSIFIDRLHIRKIRFTGGEPTIDKKLVPLLEYMSDTYADRLELSIGVTTNGLKLHRMASLYKSLGVNAVNVSLDTLNPDRFQYMTRTNGWNQAYKGLMTAISTGFDLVKLNCVVMKGVNDDEIHDFAKLAQDYPIEVRFIEFMPFQGNDWSKDKMVSYKDIKKRVQEVYPNIIRQPAKLSDTSKLFKEPPMKGSIGFISSMTDNFCSGCNRLRLTADGNLKVCLFDNNEISLRNIIRTNSSDDEIVQAVHGSLQHKKERHSGECNMKRKSNRIFSHLNSKGQAKMVNIALKEATSRIAIAQGRIHVGSMVLQELDSLSKGDVIAVARVAGILAAKSTSNLIPLCHQVTLSGIEVDIEPCKFTNSLIVTATVEANYNTGVEMEGLMAVSISLLTIYDMCKSLNKQMVISNINLVKKCKKSSIESGDSITKLK